MGDTLPRDKAEAVFRRLRELEAERDRLQARTDLLAAEVPRLAEIHREIERANAEFWAKYRERWARLTTLPGLVFDDIGGGPPTQAWGRFRNRPFYFRYRWGMWSLAISSDEGPNPDYCGVFDPTAFEANGCVGDKYDGCMFDEAVIEIVERSCREFVALSSVHEAFERGAVDAITWFYVLWRWNFQDQATTMDQPYRVGRSLGLRIESLWEKNGILALSDGKIRARSTRKRIKHSGLGERGEDGSPPPVIDVLQRCYWYVRTGRFAHLQNFVCRLHDRVLAVARALHVVLTDDSQERRWLEVLIDLRRSDSKRGSGGSQPDR